MFRSQLFLASWRSRNASRDTGHALRRLRRPPVTAPSRSAATSPSLGKASATACTSKPVKPLVVTPAALVIAAG
jgi:hypothetical protein